MNAAEAIFRKRDWKVIGYNITMFNQKENFYVRYAEKISQQVNDSKSIYLPTLGKRIIVVMLVINHLLPSLVYEAIYVFM